ncbi:MAG TPA: glycoside hydrolase family 2 TIM barrel-domain containing protein [Telluria sp.]|nr:glycoside hydrolase family 2 TIM barrel-domain containing protein [Telluria sp.]
MSTRGARIAILAALLLPLAAWAQARQVLALDADWNFRREGAPRWEHVTLPHSFGQGLDDGAAAYRGAGWYRRTLLLPRQAGGSAAQRHFLEFDGAMMAAEVWVNGHRAGSHAGGFARFRFDITRWLTRGRNTIAVRVDNTRDKSVAPLGGDYTMHGGLYRGVRLVTTADVHFDLLDHGGPGVYLEATPAGSASARLAWTARVANERDRPVRVEVAARLRDAAGGLAASARKTVTLAPHSVTAVTLDGVLPAPHLWQGVTDPYLYTSEAELRNADGQTRALDRLSFQSGIRDIRLDPERGLLLNGVPYAVHGVNVHQTMAPGKGPAVTDAEIDADYRILADLGVTGLRYAHYQHPQHAYELADRLGWLVWTELPLTAEIDGGAAFQANSVQQLRELIRQNRNHPSVMVWGLGNEIYRADADSARLLSLLHRLAQREDPTRPTVYANCCSAIDGPQASHTDAVGSNVYFGWYDGEFADLGPFLDANHARRPDTPLAISEYGAGAGAQQEEDPPRRPQAGGRWHPEQYQALYHEAAWRQIRARPWLWSSFVWVGFDFPSSGRNEGERAGFNDKGLVSFDRSIRKDAYFWYQANWTSKPMVHITSRRHALRRTPEAQVKVYSNQASASLRLNGADLGARPVVDHVASWDVRLAEGVNRIETQAGAVAADNVEWRYQPAR